MATATPSRISSSPAQAAAATEPLLDHRARAVILGAASVTVAVVAWVLPPWPAGADMGSTHYMGLLAAHQPWNLLLFMVVPVVAAETIAVTELVILTSRGTRPVISAVNRYVGFFAGLYFLGVVAYLLHRAVVPLTQAGGWRGPADLIAVGFYLLGLVPLYGMTLLEARLVGTHLDRQSRLRLHATFVGVFLVVAHVAMIFGMLDPTVLGWSPTHTMPGGDTMPGMTHTLSH